MKELDDLLGTLHDDKTERFDDRLSRIEREIMRRRLISAENTTNLFDTIRGLSEDIMRLLPESEHTFDLHRKERTTLEAERRALERELRDELSSRWRDLQALRREQRELQDELRGHQQRYEQFMKDYDS